MARPGGQRADSTLRGNGGKVREAPPPALSADQLFLSPPQIVEEIRQVQEGRQGSEQKEAGLQKEMQIQALEMEKLSSNLALLKKSLDGFQVSPPPFPPPEYLPC